MHVQNEARPEMAGLVLAGLVCACVRVISARKDVTLMRLRVRLLLFTLVGLLALAAPLFASANGPGPGTG
jgi:hypothetical protein